MENQGISTGIPEDTWNISSENSLEDFGKGKMDALKESIDDIQTMIIERQKLSESILKDGERMKAEITNFLLQNQPVGEDDSEFARERAELRKKQMEISELQLNEKVNCWKDIALLKKELRENQQELNEKGNRLDELAKILEE